MPRERRRRRRRGSSNSGGSTSLWDVPGKIVGAEVGLVGNLLGDVKDAVVGLPMGTVALATHPIRTGQDIGKQTWHTYSPLFHGDFQKFGKQLYDHPLAPLLDVLTVVSLGAGGAARGASALTKAGVGGARVEKVAGLRGLKAPVKLSDPKGTRHDLEWHPSPRAARFAMQQARMSIEQHMPDWYVKPMQRMRYERAWVKDMGGRVAAKSLVLSQILEAGRRLTDDVTAPMERQKLLVGNHLGLIHHGIELDPAEAIRLGANKRKGHYTYARDILAVGGDAVPRIEKLRRQELRYQYEREANAELANSVAKIEKELADANHRLARMHSEGVRIAMPANQHRREPTPRQIMEQQAAPFKEQERIVRDAERRLTKAREAERIHNRAVDRINDVRTQRVALEERTALDAYAFASVSDEAFEAAARNLGRLATTRSEKLAARTAEGKVVVVPRHDAYNLGLEMESSSKFVKYVYHKPTQLWKLLTIGYAPRAVTNNAVGNWTLYALREGPSPDAFMAVRDAIQWQYGKQHASQIFDEAFNRRDIISQEFGDVIGNVFSAEQRGQRRLSQGLYPIVHTVADKPVRVASLYRFFRGLPEVKAYMKSGVDVDTAIRNVLRDKPELRSHAVDHVNKTAGDYVGLTNAEKHARQIVPFYLWYRHIARTTGNLVADTPARAAVLSRLSALGIEDTKELLGEIPEFLNGAIPLSAIGLGGDKDRPDIMLTSSLNPFASIGELASLVDAFGPGTGRSSQAAIGINPLLTGTVEYLTGRNLLTGAPKDAHGGLFTSLAYSTAEGLPQARLLKALAEEDTTKNAAGNEALYAKDDRSPLTGIFGVPLRSVSTQVAEALAQTEAGAAASTGRRRRRRR